ncbi:serine threonine- kinase sgk2 [Trichoderma arundinaceum]|uniref:non-specific serine/threonine protein kinase n=1 Tax=Trichoderma arundinaceum TaxID=490622 RepID=A0A395N9G2_TRIAR|nr:serine threonine- kinase sgk2 [Trichoderma arundinaceum]
MLDADSQRLISQNPIGNGLDEYRALFRSRCEAQGLEAASEAFHELSDDGRTPLMRSETWFMLIVISLIVLKELLIKLLVSLIALPAALSLCPRSSEILAASLSRLLPSIIAGSDPDRLIPLLRTALDSDDGALWESAIKSVQEFTPPPQPAAPQQTPSNINSGSLVNTSELRKDMDHVLNQELSNIHVNVPNFRSSYFCIDSLDRIARSVLERCRQGDDPIFSNGWTGWPQIPEEQHVLSWFSHINEKLIRLAKDVDPTLPLQRPPKLRTKSNQPIEGSIATRMMDIGYVGYIDEDDADLKYHWSHVMVVGELKKSPTLDNRSGSWLDLARYAREVFAAQDNRRFVLGFTLCGSLMRLWAFDRLGGIASERFDVNQDPLEFVSVVIGFLLMNNEQLGYDPTILKSGNRQYIEIQRDGQTEKLFLEQVIFRQACIVGRATTCWKAYREGDKKTFVVKDSWQYPERHEEGLMLREADAKGVENIAKYHHHEVVRVGGIVDDINSSVRKGLDLTAAVVSSAADSEQSSPANSAMVSNSGHAISGQRETPADRNRTSRSSNVPSRKRLLPQVESRVHPRKRRSPMSTTTSRKDESGNRIHRRVVIQSYGKRIYKASSKAALLAGLEGCINGHESLYRRAGLLHRDISINNLMVNEEEEDPSRRAFLIDLDLAIEERRTAASGAKGKTGTRAFMAIGVLYGEQHSYIHDLESFFWVLYWICVHYDGPGLSIGTTDYERWNYMNDDQLATYKTGFISDERRFLQRAETHFTAYYRPLIPWVNRLRRAVFPNGKPREARDEGLYAVMKGILREARISLE